MTRLRPHSSQRGFTLIEILIVTALLGVVMAAVFGLVQTTQRHAHTAEEVVEVQQNLRVALERMSRDLRMAGLGIDDDQLFVSAPNALRCEDQNNNGQCLDAGESDVLTFRTLSAAGAVARIAGDTITTTASPTTDQVLTLSSADGARLFESDDLASPPYVHARIVRPATRVQPLDRVFRVMAVNDTASSVALRGFSQSVTLRPGDLLARVDDPNLDNDNDANTNPPEHPNRITYRLVKAEGGDDAQFLLARVPTGVDPDDQDAFEILASKITEVSFNYLTDNNDDVRAVRITLTGATDETQTGVAGYTAQGQSNVKTRSLTTVVQLRNR